MQDSGELSPLARTKAASMVMPMAVSPDRRFLFAAARSKPFTVYTYSIDRSTGALDAVVDVAAGRELSRTSRSTAPAASCSRRRTGATSSASTRSAATARVGADPLQVIPVGRHAHSIRIDASNRFVYVPTLGSDAIFVFDFDAKTGKLASATPAVALMKAMTGPRHFVTSPDNKFLYVLSEFLATVTTSRSTARPGC